MSRDQIAVILDAHLALEDGRGQVAELGDDTAQQADDQAVDQQRLREKESENAAEDDAPQSPADRTFDGLLRADLRAEFMFAQGVAGEVGHDVCSKGCNDHQPDQVFDHRSLFESHHGVEADVVGKEDDIEDAGDGRQGVFQFSLLDFEQVQKAGQHDGKEPEHVPERILFTAAHHQVVLPQPYCVQRHSRADRDGIAGVDVHGFETFPPTTAVILAFLSSISLVA